MPKMYLRLVPAVLVAVLSASAVTAANAQAPGTPPAASTASPTYATGTENFFQRYEERATKIQSQQPKWIVPVVSPYPMLIQVFRADFSRQISPTLVTNWNLGTTRGLNLIPFNRTEIDILIPGYFEHGDKTLDGFGDFTVSGKLRILSGNEQHGNYLLSAFVTASVPTGSYANGATDALVTPALTGGKGFKKFDAFTTISGTLPTGNQKVLGRNIATNSVFQYHALKYLWPEFEVNTTAFYGSTKDGKVQTFLTPGLVVGNYKRHPKDEKARLGLVAGVGFQDAATHYHLYNHNLVFTSRIIF